MSFRTSRDKVLFMPIRRRLAALSALLILASPLPAGAQTLPLPQEAQVGPRPFYLVD
jgi:glycerophosphoryl diester phosphodiesterase